MRALTSLCDIEDYTPQLSTKFYASLKLSKLREKPLYLEIKLFIFLISEL